MRLVRRGAITIGLAVVLVVTRPVVAVAEPGELDPSFGEGHGVVTTSLTGGFDTAGAVAVQPDGKIVAAGSADDDFALVRYEPDGALDASFGDGGSVVTPLSAGLDIAMAVAVQPDGKILAAGIAVEAHQDFALARYNPDGSLDPSFGDGGSVVTDFAGSADSVGGIALQPDGKIVVGGTATPGQASGPELGLARYDADGRLDPGFGDGGKVVLTLQDPQGAGGQDVVLQLDGKIVIAGNGLNGMVAARVLPDGALDPSFGDGGASEAPFGTSTSAGAVALQPDGAIVMAGQVLVDTRYPWLIGVARLTADGAPDPGFGGDGTVTTEITGYDGASGLLIQPDGKIVAVGEAQGDFALVRYAANGDLDPSFAGDGITTTGLPGQADDARAAALQPDGKVVAAGTFAGNVAVARYQGG